MKEQLQYLTDPKKKEEMTRYAPEFAIPYNQFN